MKGKQTRVAAEVSSLLYNAEKQTVVYVSRNRLMQYNIEKLAEKELRSWNTPTTMLAWRGESIFARNNQSLLVLGATGENEYEIAALTTDSTVHFGPENRNVWILSEGVLNKLELRKMQGLFGLLRQGKS